MLGPISPPIGTRFQYWALLLTPFLPILGIVLVWRKRQRIKGWGVLLATILSLAVVSFLLKLALTRTTLPSMLVFHPELGYSLIAVSTLGIGCRVIYTAMYLRMRRSE